MMQMQSVRDSLNDPLAQATGIVHIACSLGSRASVDRMSERLQAMGFGSSTVRDKRETDTTNALSWIRMATESKSPSEPKAHRRRWELIHHRRNLADTRSRDWSMRNVWRNIDEVAGTGLRSELQTFAPAHAGAPADHANHACKFPVMMRARDRFWINCHRAGPKLVCTGRRVVDGAPASSLLERSPRAGGGSPGMVPLQGKWGPLGG
jgi:hypothetical protein